MKNKSYTFEEYLERFENRKENGFLMCPACGDRLLYKQDIKSLRGPKWGRLLVHKRCDNWLDKEEKVMGFVKKETFKGV